MFTTNSILPTFILRCVSCLCCFDQHNEKHTVILREFSSIVLGNQIYRIHMNTDFTSTFKNMSVF